MAKNYCYAHRIVVLGLGPSTAIVVLLETIRHRQKPDIVASQSVDQDCKCEWPQRRGELVSICEPINNFAIGEYGKIAPEIWDAFVFVTHGQSPIDWTIDATIGGFLPNRLAWVGAIRAISSAKVARQLHKDAPWAVSGSDQTRPN